jgi:hypothetical protein
MSLLTSSIKELYPTMTSRLELWCERTLQSIGNESKFHKETAKVACLEDELDRFICAVSYALTGFTDPLQNTPNTELKPVEQSNAADFTVLNTKIDHALSSLQELQLKLASAQPTSNGNTISE